MRLPLFPLLLAAAVLNGCIEDNSDAPADLGANLVQAQIDDGHEIAQTHCSSCHGIEGTATQSPNPKAPLFKFLLSRYNAETLQAELSDGMRVSHDPMPQFQFRPDAVNSLISYLRSIQVQDLKTSLVEGRCGKCHATGKSGASPYPGAQPFRNLQRRWSRDQLREALLAGIIAEHDQSSARLPPMKLKPEEIDALLEHLNEIGYPVK